jgi:quinol-cytochrome oxidoreductase complex cytochrome b subunit
MKKFYNIWNSYLPTSGQIDLALFLIACISGLPLALGYNITRPYDSLELLALKSPIGHFIRSIHYWSSHLFLIFMLLHVFEYLTGVKKIKIKAPLWIRLVIMIPIIFYLMLSGFLLRADSEAQLALEIFRGLINILPGSSYLEFIFLGKKGDYQIIYLHHIATATIYTAAITYEHVKKIWSDHISTTISLALVFSLSLILPVSLAAPDLAATKGPWYFIGLQELLHWLPLPSFAIIIPILLLAISALYPYMKNSLQKICFIVLLASLGVYTALTIIGFIFRGPYWRFIIPWQ